MAIFGLESTDIAFLGLLFGVIGAIFTPTIIFLINMGKKMAILVNYVETHEKESTRERELLDKVVVKLAVIETRVKVLERPLVTGKRIGAMDLGEDTNGS